MRNLSSTLQNTFARSENSSATPAERPAGGYTGELVMTSERRFHR